jgi:uncharacterized protein YutE (UPF0331/DUF86 family)
MKSKENTSKIADLIKKAIDDLELTTTEYQDILSEVNADGVVDEDERRLLQQLQELISNGTVKRVPG